VFLLSSFLEKVTPCAIPSFARKYHRTSRALGRAAIMRLSRLAQEEKMNTDALSQTRFDVYRAVTDCIIAGIEAGAGEFVMPWHGNGVVISKPKNVQTCMEYHGINVIALWAQAYVNGFQSGYWASYRQWQNVGGQVKKGSQGSTIVFYKPLDTETSEGATEDEKRSRFVARASRVFNADQIEGWAPSEPERPLGTAETLGQVEAFVAATGADVYHGGTIACYRIGGDYIEMPDRDRFIGTPTSTATEAYASTTLHELVHWSGAKHRLDRGFEGVFTKEARAAEELVAEIGAAFLCADLGVASVPRPDHAAYVASWLQLLKNDARAIFTASKLANRAAAYLHELVAGSDE
jgi:antirestriction protein ArdC